MEWYDWHTGHIRTYFATRAIYLNNEYNKVDVIPARKDFEFSSISQKFTLVAFGEMTELSAVLQKGNDSAFEIVTQFTQTPAGDGGYLAKITVKSKTSLPAGAHTDTLVLSGRNQGRNFTHNVSLSCNS